MILIRLPYRLSDAKPDGPTPFYGTADTGPVCAQLIPDLLAKYDSTVIYGATADTDSRVRARSQDLTY